MVKIKIRLTLFLLIISLLTITGCGKRVVDLEQVSPEEKIVIKFSHVVAENTPKGLAAQRFATLVKERTHGRVEVQVFPNSTLYKDGEEIQALQNGLVQMIAPATSKLSGMYPQWQVLDLPYAFEDVNAVHEAMSGYIGNRLCDSLKQNNMQALAFWDNGFKQMTNSQRPLVNPADFQGLSFRVMINSQVLKKEFERLNARAVEGPFNDLYRVLDSHEVDGQENTMSNIYSKNLYKVQPYLTLSNHGYMGYVVLTNQQFWTGLPEEVRDVLESTLVEVTEWEHEQAFILDKQSLEKIVDSGLVQVHQQTEAEKKLWSIMLKPVYSEFKNLIGNDMIDYLEKMHSQ
ncbi:C4-dicarboxylate-binding periplasmic protein precursor [Pelotomaculum sp. FP]|uniref:DctP family TRAP transporter solute-binding subunit n=1 Tax=Pelotomaculum sp. FP TaxID=261474 RepID=UPI0011024DE3|nr:DctP family TRAP transporter solute-binding subunit [Pelotomaculum sp. FP]TEB15683.1 C4-dicarboxylate-binding periplasmic protein precursor [Pelotomaculum sp. FP]